MSYSRWIHSEFYTYWCSSKSEEKEDQIFMCHTGLLEQHELKYGQVKDYLVDKEALMYDLYIDERTKHMKETILKPIIANIVNVVGDDEATITNESSINELQSCFLLFINSLFISIYFKLFFILPIKMLLARKTDRS